MIVHVNGPMYISLHIAPHAITVTSKPEGHDAIKCREWLLYST